jgi:hypothetical protein
VRHANLAHPPPGEGRSEDRSTSLVARTETDPMMHRATKESVSSPKVRIEAWREGQSSCVSPGAVATSPLTNSAFS